MPVCFLGEKCKTLLLTGIVCTCAAVLFLLQGCLSAKSEAKHGDWCYRHGHLNDALHHYELALDRTPDNVLVWLGKGNVLADLAHFDAALTCYRRAQTLAPTLARSYYLEGVLFQEQGEKESAMSAYGSAIGCPGDCLEARFNRAALLHETGMFFESLADYDVILAQVPHHWQSLAMRGKTFLCLERWADAEVDLTQSLAVHQSPGAWNDRAFVRMHLGNWEGAVADARNAVMAEPTNVNMANLAWLLLVAPVEGLRDVDEARLLWNQVQAQESNALPKEGIVAVEAALAFADGRKNEAVSMLKRQLEVGGSDQELHEQLECYMQDNPYYLRIPEAGH